MRIRDSRYYSDVSLEIPFRKCLKRFQPIKLRVQNFLMPRILDVLSILIWETTTQIQIRNFPRLPQIVAL